MEREFSWFIIGYVLIFIGILIIFSTVMYGIMSGLSGSNIHGGAAGCIVIFFIPICFGVGTDTNSLYILFILGYVVIIILLVFTILFIKRAMKKDSLTAS